MTRASDAIRPEEPSAPQIEHAVRLVPKALALNALTWTDADPIGAHARSSIRAQAEDRHQPLYGVPIAVKDNIDVARTPTTAGTPALRQHVASRDAPVVKYLRDAGAVVVAKTNLHELALGATSINPTFGTVLNPFDPGFTAGGSSGGSAAVVAIGMTPLALGTDTSGSCRVPASCCGVAGFRPSLDRYPIDGVVPVSWNRDVVGLIGKDIHWICAADRVLAPDDKEGGASEQVRLGIPVRLARDGVSSVVRQAFHDTKQRLLEAGVELVGCEIRGVPETLWSTQLAIVGFDMPRHLATYLLRAGAEASIESLVAAIGDPLVKRRLEAMIQADARGALRHSAALSKMRRLRRDVVELMQAHRLDALFYPTLVTTAARVTEGETIDIEGSQYPTGPALLRNTLLATLAGLPSISLPIGLTRDGLPIGALLEGRPGRDADLLVLATQLQPILRGFS